jgi:hypothetical protein
MPFTFDATKSRLNPYTAPSLYEFVGLSSGLGVTMPERKIGESVRKAEVKARGTSGVEERTAKISSVSAAKEILLQPAERVLLDFFLLPSDLVASVCKQLAERLNSGELPTQAAIGSFFPKKRFDDLLPDSLESFHLPTMKIEPPQFSNDPEADEARLPIAFVEF